MHFALPDRVAGGCRQPQAPKDRGTLHMIPPPLIFKVLSPVDPSQFLRHRLF